MKKDKVIIGVAAITFIVITVFGALWLSGLSAVQPTEQLTEQPTTTLIIQGPDAIEVGERVSYSLRMDGSLCYTGFPVIHWTFERGQIISEEGAEVIVIVHQLGEIVLTANFSGTTTEKVVQVHPRADISINMEKAWIHNEWYPTGLEFNGTTEPVLSLQRVLETGRTVDVDSKTWEKYQSKEIIIHEYGNYNLIAKGRALSDGRVVKVEKKITVTPHVEKGYHQFNWDNENLIQLRPSDRMAIRNFLEENMEISVDLLPDGRLKDANRINNADYVFYKDSSRNDVVCYQTVVSSKGDMVRKMWQKQVKGADGRYNYLNFDDFIVAVKMGSSATSFISTYNDSGGSSSGGGGPSPSPSIGGGGPSPSPSI